MRNLQENQPLITVIIPTYNYAEFLPRAIRSVVDQSYTNVEVIVVDDGSTDDTRDIITRSSCVNYFYQPNKGLAAARNAGIDLAQGEYLVFLDADDWLEPNALEVNYAALQHKPEIAFVSGSYYFRKADAQRSVRVRTDVRSNHYLHLLQSNYIGMHAAVMFQRWVFDTVRYDEGLVSCEDYDLYLRIARIFPVVHHAPVIATYNFHSAGLSHNYARMRDCIQAVMAKQAPYISTEEEWEAYEKGLEQWRMYEEMLRPKRLVPALEEVH